MIMDIKRGDIFLVDVSVGTGMKPLLLEQTSDVRPVVVIQNDIANKYARTVIVAVITTAISEPKLPSHVKLYGEQGILENAVILLENIRTIDRLRLVKKIAVLDSETLAKVNDAFLFSGGLNDSLTRHEETDEEREVKNYYRFIKGKVIRDTFEDYVHEFKAPNDPTKPRNIIKNEVGEYIVGYLNGEGGRVFFGVKDNRIVEGIQLFSHEQDDIRCLLNNKIRGIKPTISPDHIKVEFHPVYDEESDEKIPNWYVLEVMVNRRYDEAAIYLEDGKRLHIKGNGVNNSYKEILEMFSFVKKRAFEEFNRTNKMRD